MNLIDLLNEYVNTLRGFHCTTLSRRIFARIAEFVCPRARLLVSKDFLGKTWRCARQVSQRYRLASCLIDSCFYGEIYENSRSAQTVCLTAYQKSSITRKPRFFTPGTGEKMKGERAEGRAGYIDEEARTASSIR